MEKRDVGDELAAYAGEHCDRREQSDELELQANGHAVSLSPTVATNLRLSGGARGPAAGTRAQGAGYAVSASRFVLVLLVRTIL